ncbi:MAG: hypothetical protein JW821_11710 [Deltaproteobacteria bacterium]|nr:hypothetical protein [Deltaproteobacteria bacterium]
MTDPAEPTLCMPDGEKSCFACCPPIRPAGYEHLSYKNIIRRVLRENTQAYDREERGIRPITGFSCWALGYLDGGAARVGCLLHPLQNQGEDLRYRVDYGGKCRRETCPEAKVFSLLQPEQRRFWLGLTKGLDAFSYSSTSENFLFRLLGWGSSVLGLIASVKAERPPRRESFFQDYPFFSTPLEPKACAYLLKGLLDRDRVRALEDPCFRTDFERLHRQISESPAAKAGGETGDPPVHLQGLDPEFAKFLSLSLGVKRASPQDALRLKERVDEALEEFQRSM